MCPSYNPVLNVSDLKASTAEVLFQIISVEARSVWFQPQLANSWRLLCVPAHLEKEKLQNYGAEKWHGMRSGWWEGGLREGDRTQGIYYGNRNSQREGFVQDKIVWYLPNNEIWNLEPLIPNGSNPVPLPLSLKYMYTGCRVATT